MGPDNLYCGKWKKISKLRSDLDLGLTMPNIKLVRDIFLYTTMYSNFMFLDQLLFELSCKNTETQKHANTHAYTHTYTRARTHTDSDEYCIVAFCKNATLTINKR